MFNLEKKLNFYEDQDLMAIEFKWHTPIAYFYLFFTVIWNAFLLFWYSMAFTSGAPLVFILFPILHVLVGIFLIYFTVCQFVNKTNIEIDDDYLTIRHGPIPWWRGNVDIRTREIDQLYVKETKSTDKNGTSYSYSLRAKLTDNRDKEILSITGVENTQMQVIEEHLERFIGIIDRPVKGEYQKNRPATELIEPRRHRRDFTNAPLGGYYFMEHGEEIDFKGETLRVLSITQFDWNDGNSDKLIQLTNETGEERLIYFDQNKALLQAWAEENLSIADIGSLDFEKHQPSKSIEIQGNTFHLMQYKTGHQFVSGMAEPLDAEEWIYLSDDHQTNLRVIDNNGVIQYYRGTKLEVSDFEDSLDLDTLPEKDVLYNDPDWEEEDLV